MLKGIPRLRQVGLGYARNDKSVWVGYDIGMNVRQFIHDRVCDAAGVCGGQVSKPDERFGDWATNIAFDLAKQEKRNPREVAVELAAKLERDSELMKVVEKIAVEGGGFINFHLSSFPS